jgi:lipopolysaccharide export system protein LptC
MESDEVARAIAATISIAAALDLQADDATVLQNSNKLALCDCCRATSSPESQLQGRERAAFEVELAQRLAETEAPVAALEPGGRAPRPRT